MKEFLFIKQVETLIKLESNRFNYSEFRPCVSFLHHLVNTAVSLVSPVTWCPSVTIVSNCIKGQGGVNIWPQLSSPLTAYLIPLTVPSVPCKTSKLYCHFIILLSLTPFLRKQRTSWGVHSLLSIIAGFMMVLWVLFVWVVASSILRAFMIQTCWVSSSHQ